MSDNNNKLSLHIAKKNLTVMTSGFADVSAIPVITAKLTLNRQTIARLGNSGLSTPITFISNHMLGGCVTNITQCGTQPITFISAHALNGCPTYTCCPNSGPAMGGDLDGD